MRNIFGVIIMGGMYSLISAILFVVLDAVDVAFTEAAVGAGNCGARSLVKTRC